MENDTTIVLSNIIFEMSPELETEYPNGLPEDVPLVELGIGGYPIGLGELIDLKEKIEKRFEIYFSDDEIPDYFESQEVTLSQIIAAVDEKRKTPA
ncbi:MAG: hypothetical protein MRY49_00590 [Candidatus Pacebacteria bacterium]|nr:hypothetical protein [Candidatus Paceibacterota bacterium]